MRRSRESDVKIPDFPEERTESIEEEYVPASMPEGGRKNGPYNN